jgi:uncharacterized protein with HEPN domain
MRREELYLTDMLFAVDWQIVWVAATQEAQHLREQVRQILANEYER